MALIAIVTGVASARPLGHEAQSVIDALLEHLLSKLSRASERKCSFHLESFTIRSW